MKSVFLTNILPVMIAIAVTGSCAKQAAPGGGPRDVTPPVILKCSPPSGTTNFSSSKITITFNEFIALDKINEKFMVSPPMDKKPEISIKGKNLVIEFAEALRDSTTYTMYFQDAIRDLNEGNPIRNYQYVFATGKVIDSLSLTGNVLFAENLEAGKNILVMLHSNLADSAPAKLLPDYITLADLNGGFRIDNIKEGDYRLYALSDNNNNKRFDLADEPFAFNDTILHINPADNWLPVKSDTLKAAARDSAKAGIKSTEGKHKLYLFTAPKKKYYLTSSSRTLPYQLIYTLSLPPDTMDFRFDLPGTNGKDFMIENNLTRDTMIVWLIDSALYSKQELKTFITYPSTDSTGNNYYKKDTVTLRYITPKPTKGKQRKPPLKFILNIPGSGMSPGQKIEFTSLTPLKQPDTSRIRLYETLSKNRIPVKYQLQADISNLRKYILNAPLKEDRKYLLITDSEAFSNIYGDVSDSLGTGFSVRTTNSYGHLQLNITNGKGNLVVQLLDNKEKVIAERKIVDKGPAVFPLLEKGNYRIRIIYDLNGDGKWTTGDFSRKLQAEPVSYYPEEIQVKVDWNVENEWDVGTKYFKNESLRAKPGQ